MSARLRRRPGRRVVWRLEGEVIHAAALGTLPAEGYAVLRDELLAMPGAEFCQAIFRHEPDVPDWLRSLPTDQADAALVMAVEYPSPANEAAYHKLSMVVAAVLAGRRTYLERKVSHAAA